MEKVISFEKDDKFYFKKGNEFLINNKPFLAIEYLQKAIKKAENKTTFLKCSYYIVLAQCYSVINCLELSNFYYFLALENDVFAQIVFRGLGENFYLQNDIYTSKFYLNQCVNLLETSQIALSAKEKLVEISKDEKYKFHVIKNENTLNFEEQRKLQKFISTGKFNEAIMLLEAKKDFYNSQLRAELALAYIFTNNTKKGIELINKYGNNSLTDLCNLLSMYFINKDEEKYNEIKTKLLNFKIENDEQLFKIGLTFAQTENYEKAKEYMSVYFSKNANDIELKPLYAITCLNCGENLLAKNILIDLKLLNPFNSFVFDYYLKICNGKSGNNYLQYIFTLPLSEYSKVQNKIKEFLVLNQNDLLNEFNKNGSLFYFLANNEESLLSKTLFLKLSKIDDENVNKFFKYALIMDNLKEKTKNEIALNRLSLDSATSVSLVRNNIFTKIVVPNIIATKSNNQNIFEALVLTLKFILFETFLMNVNLKRQIIKIERIIKQDKINAEILASFICWDYLKDKRVTTLNKICKYFNVLQKDFYKLVEDYNLDV